MGYGRLGSLLAKYQNPYRLKRRSIIVEVIAEKRRANDRIQVFLETDL